MNRNTGTWYTNGHIQMTVSNIMANFHFLKVAPRYKHYFTEGKVSLASPGAQESPPHLLLPWLPLGLPVTSPQPGPACLASASPWNLPDLLISSYISPFCSFWNILFHLSAGGVLIAFSRLDLPMMFSAKIPKTPKKSSGPWAAVPIIG